MFNIGQASTSMEVAQIVDKKHSDLLKDIRRYVGQLAEGNISLSVVQQNFKPHDIARAFEMLCGQFGIQLPGNFVSFPWLLQK